MTYKELIERALKGRTVNRAAHEWQMPQKTLDRYAKAERMPDYQTALIIAREAGVDAGEVMRICAAEEALKKPRSMFAEMGFATAAFLMSVNLFLTPQDTQAAPRLTYSPSTPQHTLYYVKFTQKDATCNAVIPPFMKRPESRDYAAKASFCFGVMPPRAMLGRS